MDLGIAGRRALVCGASRGLGKGCAAALAREGVAVTILARNAETLAATAAELQAATGADVRPVVCDVTTTAGRAAALAALPDPDILVTNAAGPPPGDFRDWDERAWHAALDANMVAPLMLIRAVVDGMAARGFGRIVNITASAVKRAHPRLGLSAGARAGLTGAVAGIVRQVAGRNVTINNLLPGSFDTDRLRELYAAEAERSGRSATEVAASAIAGIPAGRLGRGDEFGAICAFLCSSQAGYITGQNILLDGGAYPGVL